jgi:hypothetical protein
MFASVEGRRYRPLRPKDPASSRPQDLFAGPDNAFMEQKETYICTDIEADGPIPGPHAIISLTSAAFSSEGRLLDTFAAQPPVAVQAAGNEAIGDENANQRRQGPEETG